jgi:hypothetical protein
LEIRNQDQVDQQCKSSNKLAHYKHQTQHKDQKEDRKLGVIADSGRIPAVEVFRQRSQDSCQYKEQGRELEQPPHQPMVQHQEYCPQTLASGIQPLSPHEMFKTGVTLSLQLWR